MAGEFDDIRQRLEGIAEELADLAILRLRESIDAGGTELPVDERRLTRARRALVMRFSSTGSSVPPASMLSRRRIMARSASSSAICSSRWRMSSNSPAML